MVTVSAGSQNGSFIWPVRVYWEDTDASGLVYHASYLRFLERARSEWLRALGLSQYTLEIGHGLAFLVRDMRLDFLHAALLDDELHISVQVRQRRRASMVFEQTIWRVDGTKLLEASVRLVCVDTQRMQVVGIPSDITAIWDR